MMVTAPRDHLKKEAQDLEYITVHWNDIDWKVKHPQDWPGSANTLLQTGRLNEWAEKALVEDDQYSQWLDIDPTPRQLKAFFTTIGEVVGMSLGESSASRRRSMRMAM